MLHSWSNLHRKEHLPQRTNKAWSAAMHSPTVCAARPIALHNRPNRWPSLIDIGPIARHWSTKSGARRPPGQDRYRVERAGGSSGARRPSRTPAELCAWLRQRDEVVQLLDKVEDVCQRLEPLEHAFDTHRPALVRGLTEAGENVSRADSGLADVLEQAEAVLKRNDELTQRRAQLENKLATAQADRATAELSLETAEAELIRWRAEWSLMMARIGLEANATPEQAEVFLTKISELLTKLNDRRTIETRIRGMDRDAGEFARDVRTLASRVAPDLADKPAAEQTRELGRRLRDSQADTHRRTTLIEQRIREEGIVNEAEIRRDEARICLERLCNEAGCVEIDDLPEAERRS